MSDRPEIMHEPRGAQDFGVVEKELTVFERLFNMVWLRKCILLVLIAVIWEVYGRHLDNQLLVPTFSDTVTALWGGIKSGVLLDRSWTSVKVLLIGFSTGVFLAAVLTILASRRRWGRIFSKLSRRCSAPCPPSRCCRWR